MNWRLLLIKIIFLRNELMTNKVLNAKGSIQEMYSEVNHKKTSTNLEKTSAP